MGFPFGKEFIPRRFEEYCRERTYTNFNWFVVWTVTFWCNLNCRYCYVDDKTDKDRNVDLAVGRIIEASPRFLALHGGEPLLVPELKDALKRIHEKSPRTFILTETNATHPDKVLDCLPYLNHVEISLDGLGEINRKVRGVDGDLIFRNFQAIHEQAKKKGTTVSISTVLTTVNYRRFTELVQAPAKHDPEVQFALFVMHPREDPLSVCHDPAVWKECREMVDRVCREHPNVKFKGDLTVRSSCRCGAQFFIRHIDKNGNWFDCKPHMHIKVFRMKTAHLKGLRGQLEILRQAFHLLDVLVLRKNKGLTCYAPCDWGEPLDPVFGYGEKLEESITKMIGALTDSEIRKLRSFIEKNINPNLPEGWESLFE